jgi:hypothetical protein
MDFNEDDGWPEPCARPLRNSPLQSLHGVIRSPSPEGVGGWRRAPSPVSPNYIPYAAGALAWGNHLPCEEEPSTEEPPIERSPIEADVQHAPRIAQDLANPMQYAYQTPTPGLFGSAPPMPAIPPPAAAAVQDENGEPVRKKQRRGSKPSSSPSPSSSSAAAGGVEAKDESSPVKDKDEARKIGLRLLQKMGSSKVCLANAGFQVLYENRAGIAIVEEGRVPANLEYNNVLDFNIIDQVFVTSFLLRTIENGIKDVIQKCEKNVIDIQEKLGELYREALDYRVDFNPYEMQEHAGNVLSTRSHEKKLKEALQDVEDFSGYYAKFKQDNVLILRALEGLASGTRSDGAARKEEDRALGTYKTRVMGARTEGGKASEGKEAEEKQKWGVFLLKKPPHIAGSSGQHWAHAGSVWRMQGFNLTPGRPILSNAEKTARKFAEQAWVDMMMTRTPN